MEGPRDAIERFEFVENISRMCTWLGIEPPSDDECFRLGREMNLYVRTNGRFVFNGASEAIRALSEEFQLHMATGNPSWTTRANLDQIGVSHLFGVLCGPDLIGSNKWHDVGFYSRLFAAAGVAPERAVVVDDSAEMLARARAAGALTVQVGGEDDHAAPAGNILIANLVQLPKALSSLRV